MKYIAFIVYAAMIVLMLIVIGCGEVGLEPVLKELTDNESDTPTVVQGVAGCYTGLNIEGSAYKASFNKDCIDSLFTSTDNMPKSETLVMDCEFPFGVDSQQILNEGGLELHYKIGVVSDIDLERNDDGTWYIADCRILSRTLYFQAPYPQQNEINDGDIIGFQAITKCNTTWRGTTCWYSSGKLIENISLQSADCQIDDVNQLSNPSASIPSLATKDDFVDVTGLVMAVETIKNANLEPDDSADYHIRNAVMKCADGNLYRVGFTTSYRAEKFGIKRTEVNRPSQQAFGEGDIITVKQIYNLFTDSFTAYYEP